MLAIDCNTAFGTRPDRRTDLHPDALVGQLARGGVRGALTMSLRGVLYDHRLGNEETLRVCSARSGLLPVATINPTRYVDWRADVDRCLAEGFRAFRFFPDQQGWSVRDAAWAELQARLAPARLPLLFTVASGGMAADVAERTADAGCPVVLLLGHYASEAETTHLCRRYGHVHVDLARRATPHAVRHLAEECGVDRVLFGTNAPEYCLQPALNMVFAAGLSETDTAQILSGNLLRLLGAGRPPSPSLSGVGAEPGYRGYRGPTIDVHAHLGVWRYPALPGTVDDTLAFARRYGLERVLISSALGIVYDMPAGNAELKELIDPHPALLGYVVTNPNLLEESIAELDSYADDPKFVGVKIHCEYSRAPTSSVRVASLFAEIARRGRPVKIHTFGLDWMHGLREVARRHPDLPIIIAHGGGWGAGPFFRDEGNVYFEFCGSSSARGLIREVIASVGAERVLFGTDQNLFDPAYAFGQYHDAELTHQEAEKVMRLNAKQLFALG